MHEDEMRRIALSRLWGYEVDWYATDAEGFIAHFTTNGEGDVPTIILEDLDAYEALTDTLNSMDEYTKAVVAEGKGRNDHWLNIARRGVYSYDYRKERQLYTIRALPASPIHLSIMPKQHHELLQIVTFRHLLFKSHPPVDIKNSDMPNTSTIPGWQPS